jgi:hypothetical protein
MRHDMLRSPDRILVRVQETGQSCCRRQSRRRGIRRGLAGCWQGTPALAIDQINPIEICVILRGSPIFRKELSILLVCWGLLAL